MPDELIEKGKTYVNDLVEKIIPTPSYNPTEQKNTANSVNKKNNIKTLVATLKIEGNPLLKTNEVVTVSNVALRHAGNWLVEKIVHEIGTGQAYLCTVELAKNGTIKPVSKSKAKASTNSGKSKNKVNKSQGSKNASATKKVYSWDANGNPNKDNPYKGKK